MTNPANSARDTSASSPKIIFFGNGPLADATKATLLQNGLEIIFHARKASDLERVKTLMQELDEKPLGILASFGVLIKSDILELFEPTGVLNLHPSLLPKYRGPSPIETAIVNGDTKFGISIMKLVKVMDAGPIFYQTTLDFDQTTDKITIYEQLAITGTKWLVKHINNLPTPVNQDDSQATFTKKLDTNLAPLTPDTKPAERLYNEIRAYQKFPKSRYTFFNHDCIILSAHISNEPSPLSLKCKDDLYLCIDKLQPAGKKPMDAKSFLNGYSK